MAHYKISDIAEEVKDRENNPAESVYDRFVGLEHYVSGDLEIIHFGSSKKLESAMKVFRAGDTLVARRNVYLKRASIVQFDGLTSGDSIVLRAKQPVMARILPFVLNTDDFWDYAEKYSDGTMSKRLSPKILMEYEFNISNDRLEDISEILWAANKTRNGYKKLLHIMDELVKSRFIEMFGGNLDRNITLKEVSTKGPQNGFYKKDAEINGTIPIIKMKQLFANEAVGEARDCDKVALTEKELENFKLTSRDLLFGRRSLVVEGAGKCRRVGRLEKNMIFESSLLRITLNEELLLPRFLQIWLETEEGKNSISSIRAVTTIAGIKGSDLARLKVPTPPISLQKSFLDFVAQVDKSKLALQESLDKLENLQKALIKQYLC